MADNKKAWEDVHRQAIEEYTRDYDKERANIDDAYEDLRFRRGRQSDQWDEEALKARKGRPCHVVNKLPQFIRQVTGDMRRKRPGIKVVPVDSGADIETADIRGGMIRYVENRSKAKHVYTTGADSQVTCGIGHWQVLTEYANAGTFNQEIRIAGVEDGVAVVWDADATGPVKEDADHCFVPVDMSIAKFKKKWPNAQTAGFEQHGDAFSTWSSDEHIRVAAYWKKKPIKRTLALMPDGSIDDLTDILGNSEKQEAADGLKFLQSQGARIEERDSYRICRYLMTMAEILEESDWAGMHIPIIPVIGEEVRVGRELYRHGIVRYARDLQKMVNYYSSAETEVVALQPKAPWLGTKKMFQNNYDLWETANTENHPFLEYVPDPTAPGGKPERVTPPVASQAIQQGALNAANDMKAVIGIYDASLGARSNETSGIAIERRDEQGDTGTFVYHDNFALAIERTAEIVNELFPKIYDTQRTMRIIGDDGKPMMAEINKPLIMNGITKIQHDMSAGSYDVVMEEGPSYATKREAAQTGITEFIRAFPPAAPLIGDIYAKIMDFPHAEEIGERLEEALPPPIKAKLQQERAEAEQAAGKPPSPEVQQQAQAQQEAQQKAQAAEQMQMAEMQAKVMEAEAKAQKAKADARKAIADADRAESEAQKAKADLAQTHMDNLRDIEAHDHDMARGHVQHEQNTRHAQDRHEIDLTLRGFGEARAQRQHERDDQSHDITIKQMQQPAKEPA